MTRINPATIRAVVGYSDPATGRLVLTSWFGETQKLWLRLNVLPRVIPISEIAAHAVEASTEPDLTGPAGYIIEAYCFMRKPEALVPAAAHERADLAFLTRLLEAARQFGNSGDWPAVREFVLHCHDDLGAPRPAPDEMVPYDQVDEDPAQGELPLVKEGDAKAMWWHGYKDDPETPTS